MQFLLRGIGQRFPILVPIVLSLRSGQAPRVAIAQDAVFGVMGQRHPGQLVLFNQSGFPKTFV
jgi:hypothetical protein